MQRTNEFLTDFVTSKFSGLLGGLDAIEDPKEMEEELAKDKHLKRDVVNIITTKIPYLPYIGQLSGDVTIGKYWF